MKKGCKKKYQIGGQNPVDPNVDALGGAPGLMDFFQYMQDKKVSSKDNIYATDIDNGPQAKPQGLSLIDPRRDTLHPYVQGANYAMMGVTGIANLVDNVRTGQNERMQYLKAIEPQAYENNERYGLNNLPIYTQFGGNPGAVIEAEQGEAFQTPDGQVHQISDSAPTHEEGGVIIPNAHRVLENTSSMRKDKGSKALLLTSDMVEQLTGVEAKGNMSHAEALDHANDHYEQKKAKVISKIALAAKDKKHLDKYAENSVDLNLNTIKSMPNKQDIFESLFNNQEAIKAQMGIEVGDKAQYGYGDPLPKKIIYKDYRGRQRTIDLTKKVGNMYEGDFDGKKGTFSETAVKQWLQGYNPQQHGDTYVVGSPDPAYVNKMRSTNTVTTANTNLPGVTVTASAKNSPSRAIKQAQANWQQGIPQAQPVSARPVAPAGWKPTSQMLQEQGYKINENGGIQRTDLVRDQTPPTKFATNLAQATGLSYGSGAPAEAAPVTNTEAAVQAVTNSPATTSPAAARGATQASSAPVNNWGVWKGDKLSHFKQKYGVNNAADKITDLDGIATQLGYTGPKDAKAFQKWLYESSPENKAVIDKWHKQYGETGPIGGMFDGKIGIRWQNILDEINHPKISVPPTPMPEAPPEATPAPVVPPTEDLEEVPLDTSIKNTITSVNNPQSKFHEPLRWYDLASPLNAYMSALERVPEKYNPVEFNQLRYKLQDPTQALNRTQADFNASSQQVNGGTGTGAANVANLLGAKYNADQQILAQTENQNAQIKNNEITYNTQVMDKQSIADQQAREVFENKVLTSKALQQEQKLTALDSLYKTVAQNKALNRNGNLVMKFSKAFDQYGDYNGYQTLFGVNPALAQPQAGGAYSINSAATKPQAAGGVQKLEEGKNYYNRKTGKTMFFDGKSLLER